MLVVVFVLLVKGVVLCICGWWRGCDVVGVAGVGGWVLVVDEYRALWLVLVLCLLVALCCLSCATPRNNHLANNKHSDF